MSSIRIISVDFQKDFTKEGGACFIPRPSVDFISNTLIPFLRENHVIIAEIISDYRQPRPGDPRDCCHPGQEGFESEISDDVKMKNIWIKSMNSPIWVRRGGGKSDERPGLPYQDPMAFTEWLDSSLGKPEDINEVVLIGLTIDCCVLCTAQELSFRGYRVMILREATDTRSGSREEKEMILNNPPLRHWAEVITWEKLKEKLRKQ